jgi:hypothetical protein
MPKLPRRCAAALLVTLAPLAGHGQTSPYYLGISQTFGYDSNIFRLPDRGEVALPGGGVQVVEPESSGLISTTLLLAGLDQPIGRQRLYVNLNAGYTSYAHQPQLDSPRYALTAGIDWETVEKLSGNAEFSSGLRLGSYGDRDVPAGRGDNQETYNRFTLLARIGDWKRSRAWVEAGFVADQVRNEVDFLQPVPYGIAIDPGTGAPIVRYTDGYTRDERSNAVTLGVRYRQSGALVLGAGVRTESRRTEVERQLIDPAQLVASSADSRRNDLDLFADFNPGGAHQLRARLSYADTNYDDPGAADNAGWNGSLRWAWQATGKLDSNLLLMYDTEDRERGGGSAADGYGDNKTLALEWRLRYAITSKVSANLAASGYQRQYDTLGGFTDHDTLLSLNLTWAVLRNATLGCTAGLDRRTSNAQAAVGRNSYDAQLFSCFAQLMLQ